MSSANRTPRAASPPAPDTIVFDSCKIVIRGDMIALTEGDVYYDSGKYHTLHTNGDGEPPTGTLVVMGDRIHGDPLRNVLCIECTNGADVSWQEFVRPPDTTGVRLTARCILMSALHLSGIKMENIRLSAEHASEIKVQDARSPGLKKVVCACSSTSSISLHQMNVQIENIQITCKGASDVMVDKVVSARATLATKSYVLIGHAENVEYSVTGKSVLSIPKDASIDDEMSSSSFEGKIVLHRHRSN